MDKEWVLLGYGARNLYPVMGNLLGKVLNMSWTPSGEYINLIINNEYQGVYYLCESISRGSHRVDVAKNGYIIENDAYYWKPNEVSFQSNNQPTFAGWTFKYPEDYDDMTIRNIEWLINSIEKILYNENFQYGFEDSEILLTDMLDLESCVRWIIAQDIMNSPDSAGTNIFFQKRNFSPLEPFSTKLEAGPLWDFDSAFTMVSNDFSPIWNYIGSPYHRIVKYPGFLSMYRDIFDSLNDMLVEIINFHLQEFLDSNPDLWKAYIINNKLGKLENCDINPYTSATKLSTYVENRVSVINNLLDLGIETKIEDITIGNPGDDENPDSDMNPDLPETVSTYRLDGTFGTSADQSNILIYIDRSGNANKRIK